MKQRKDQIGQWAVRLISALALLFVGFAHQLPLRAETVQGPVALAQYVLPDGTLPTLCVTIVDQSGKTHGKIWHLNPCEACRIVASVLLPQPADGLGDRIRFVAAIEQPRRAETVHRALFPPNTGPRAPPAKPISA